MTKPHHHKTPTPTPTTTKTTSTVTSGPLFRAFTVDPATIDAEARTVEVAASSEYPVARSFGFEILDHSPEAVDLSRLNNGAPVLKQHDQSSQIGVVVRAWLADDRRVRCLLRYSRSPAGDAVFQDVVDEIAVNISIGYLPQRMHLESEVNGVETYRVMRWLPFEVSHVSVGADPTVGVGRAESFDHHQIEITGGHDEMTLPNQTTNTGPAAATAPTPEQTPPAATEPAQPRDHQRAADFTQERERVLEIQGLARQFGHQAEADAAISEGHSADQFRRLIMDAMKPTPTPQFNGQTAQRSQELPNFAKAGADTEALGIKAEEMAGYSLMRAIEASASGDWSKAGFERSVSNAIEDATHKEARGFYVPHAALARSMTVGTAEKGGSLVDTALLVDQFVDMLRNKAVIGRMGARTLSGLVGDVTIPKQVTGAAFHWLGEDEDVADSDLELGTLGLTPKTIAGSVPISRKLRKQASMSVERLITTDLIEGLGIAIDYAMLHGTGTENMPLGLLNQIGLGSVTFADKINWDAVVDLETAIATNNADINTLAYLTSTAQRGVGKKTFVAAGTGERLWDKANTVNGYRAEATNQMSGDAWLFGDFSQIIMAYWGVLDLRVDPYANAKKDGLVLRVFQDCDTNIRRAESFAMATKAIAAA